MILKVVFAGAALVASAPAMAVTYIGEFHGTMLDGQAVYDGMSDFGNNNRDYVRYDLTGRSVTVTFKATVLYDTNVPYIWDDDFFDKYVDMRYSAYVDLPAGYDTRVESGSSLVKSTSGYGIVDGYLDWYAGGLVTYDGNGQGAAIRMGGELNNYQNHYAYFSLDFSDASQQFAAVSGTGSLAYGFGYSNHTHGTGNFVLNSGRVLVTDVPEPATWAMLLIGFGAIGSAVRRRRVSVRYA